MNADTLKALDESIAKYRGYASADYCGPYNLTTEGCPLCTLFFEYDCFGCPISAGEHYECYGTPYCTLHTAVHAAYRSTVKEPDVWDIHTVVRTLVHDTALPTDHPALPEIRRLAQAEVEFLKGLKTTTKETTG